MWGRQTLENCPNRRTVRKKNKHHLTVDISTSETQETKHDSRTSVNTRLILNPILKALKRVFFYNFFAGRFSLSESTNQFSTNVALNAP